MAKQGLLVAVLLLALLSSSSASRLLLQNMPVDSSTPDTPNPPPSPVNSQSPSNNPPPSPQASPSPSPSPSPVPYPQQPPYPSQPSPSPASKCYYGNSDVPLFCDASPPPPASPSPPPPAFPPPSPTTSPPPPPGKCYYGNSSTPLFCDAPPPPASPSPPASPPPPTASPPPPPGKCYYGNSSTPLFCDGPPPPASSPPPPPLVASPPPPHVIPKSPSPSPTPVPVPVPVIVPVPTPQGNTLRAIFTTGPGNYQVGATSRPASTADAEVLVESADDFFTTQAVTIKGVSFEGLLPADMTPQNQNQYITSVGALLYAVFPQDSTPARLLVPNDPSSGTWQVASREGSPADWPMMNITTAAYQIQKLSDDVITVPTVVEDFNIQPIPNQLQSGNSAPPAISGKRYEIFVPFQYNLPAGAHVFVVPQIGVNCNSATPWAEDQCGFVWSSAPYPVSYANQGTPFPSWIQDQQTWTRGPVITPDWASIGTQILDSQPYNAAFTVWA